MCVDEQNPMRSEHFISSIISCKINVMRRVDLRMGNKHEERKQSSVNMCKALQKQCEK